MHFTGDGVSNPDNISALMHLWQDFIGKFLSYVTDVDYFNTSHMSKYDTLVLPIALILLVSFVHHGRTWIREDAEYSFYQKIKRIKIKPKKIKKIKSKKSKSDESSKQSETYDDDQLWGAYHDLFRNFDVGDSHKIKNEPKGIALQLIKMISDLRIGNLFAIITILVAILIGLINLHAFSISVHLKSLVEYLNLPGNGGYVTTLAVTAWVACFLTPSLAILAMKNGFNILLFIAPALYSFIVFMLVKAMLYYVISYEPSQSISRLDYFKSIIFVGSSRNLGQFEFLYREAITHSIAYSIYPLMFGEFDGPKILAFYALRTVLRIIYDFVPSSLETICPYGFSLAYVFLVFRKNISKEKPKHEVKAMLLEPNKNNFPFRSRLGVLTVSIIFSFFIAFAIGTLKVKTPYIYQNLVFYGEYLCPYILDDLRPVVAFYVVNFWISLLQDFENGLSIPAIETVADAFFLPFVYGAYKLSRYARSNDSSSLNVTVDDRSLRDGHHIEYILLKDENFPNLTSSNKSLVDSTNGTYVLALKHLHGDVVDLWLADQVRSSLHSPIFHPILDSNALIPSLMITLGFFQLYVGNNFKKNNLDDVSQLKNLVLLSKSDLGGSSDNSIKNSFSMGLKEFIKRSDPYSIFHDKDINDKRPKGAFRFILSTLNPLVIVFASSILIYAVSTALTFSLHDKSIANGLRWSFDQIFPVFYMTTYICSMPIANSFYSYRNFIYFIDNRLIRFLLSLIPCFGYFFLRRFVRRSFNLFSFIGPLTNTQLFLSFSFAMIISAIYAFGGPLRLLKTWFGNSIEEYGGLFAYGIFALAICFEIYNAKSLAVQDILITLFTSVALDVQYTLGCVVLDLNSWLPEILGHDSLTGLGQAISFGLFESVAVFSEFKYATIFSPNAILHPNPEEVSQSNSRNDKTPGVEQVDEPEPEVET